MKILNDMQSAFFRQMISALSVTEYFTKIIRIRYNIIVPTFVEQQGIILIVEKLESSKRSIAEL